MARKRSPSPTSDDERNVYAGATSARSQEVTRPPLRKRARVSLDSALDGTTDAGLSSESDLNQPATSEPSLIESDEAQQATLPNSSVSVSQRQSATPFFSGEDGLESEPHLNKNEEKTAGSTLLQIPGAERGGADPYLGGLSDLEVKPPAQRPSRTPSPQIHPARSIVPIIADHLVGSKHSDESLVKAQPADSARDQALLAFAEFQQAIDYLNKIENGTFLKSDTYEDMIRWIKMWSNASVGKRVTPDTFVGSVLYRSQDGSSNELMDSMENLKMEMLSEITGTAVMPKDAWSLRVIDAMLYLEMVKIESEKQPHIYSQLLKLLKEIPDKNLEIPQFLERVSSLLEAHPILVLGIKHFVPPEPQAEPPAEGNPADTTPPRQEKTTLASKSSVITSEVESLTNKLDIGSSITWISPVALKVNGHFCDLYEGTHAVQGKVALKRPRIGATGYDEEISRRFEREAATWQKLRHPNILEFIGTLKRDGHLYFVSPFINSGTLAQYVLAYPDTNRIKLLFETAGAVSYLHICSIVHGDIKASNILISDNGQALLCDFGLAKTIDLRTSTAMKGAGTLRWQSPELWEDKPRSFQSDIYAFGMTIAEVLKGEVPFAHLANNSTVMRAVLWNNERPSQVPATSQTGISYAIAWSVAEACWAQNPQERIPIVEALVRIRRDPSLGYVKTLVSAE